MPSWKLPKNGGSRKDSLFSVIRIFSKTGIDRFAVFTPEAFFEGLFFNVEAIVGDFDNWRRLYRHHGDGTHSYGDRKRSVPRRSHSTMAILKSTPRRKLGTEQVSQSAQQWLLSTEQASSECSANELQHREGLRKIRKRFHLSYGQKTDSRY